MRAPRSSIDPREALRDAEAALVEYDLPGALALLRAAREAHPDDGALHDAWVALLVDHLGDDLGALSVDPPKGEVPALTRARLALAAARARRLDDGRRWIVGLDPRAHADVWAAWLDALRLEGALEEGAKVASQIRTHATSEPLAGALERMGEALRPSWERARVAERAKRVERWSRAAAAVEGMLREGRWEAALAALAKAEPEDVPGADAASEALRRAADAQREVAREASSARRVAEVERALAVATDRGALRAFAALEPGERGRVSGAVAPRALRSMLEDARVRTSEALEAALALIDASRSLDPAAALARLRPHAGSLRRVPEGRAAMDDLEARVARAPRAAPVVEAPVSPIVRSIEALAAQGHTLAAWRAAQREGLDVLAAALAPRAAARHGLRSELAVEGPPEEAHAELLRDDALVAHPVDADHAMTLSSEGATLTARVVDLRSGRVTSRVIASLDAPFAPRVFRWDRAALSAASRDLLVSVDVDDGALRSHWRLPQTELLGASPRPCGDADFAWCLGRDDRGARVAEVWDLARGERVRRFGCEGLVDVTGSGEALTLDAEARQVQLRDAHGVVLGACGLEEAGELLDAVPLPSRHGVVAVLRLRTPQSADDRRRARPPRFRLALLKLEVGSRSGELVTLRECARDDLARLAADPDLVSVWVRLGPSDLPGELLCVRATDLRVRTRRPVAAGVALRATSRRPLLAFVSPSVCSWQPDLSRDPSGTGESPPLAAHSPQLSRALRCSSAPDEAAWRAFAAPVASLRGGARGVFESAASKALRAPGSVLGLAQVLVACGASVEARELLGSGVERFGAHPAIRLCAADLAWSEGDAAAVIELLEGVELVGLGDAVVHARHLVGLARLEGGDEVGALAAWEQGLGAPLPRPGCALAGARDVVRAARGELSTSSGVVLAEALRGGSRAALLAVRASAAGMPIAGPW